MVWLTSEKPGEGSQPAGAELRAFPIAAALSCVYTWPNKTLENHTHNKHRCLQKKNPKKWEMHYRAGCLTRVSLLCFCTVWFPEAACRLPSLSVWFPLPMGLCWPSCKSLGSAVSLSHPTQEQMLQHICIWNALSRHQRPQLPTPWLVLSTSSVICFHERSIQMRPYLQWTLYDCSTFQ